MTIQRNEAEFDYIFRSSEGPLARHLEETALKVEAAQKLLLSMHGTGRVYTTRFYRDKQGRLRRGSPRPPHQASAPGEPPATDTGRLRATVSHVVATDEKGLYTEVGSGANPAIPGVDYAVYLEVGTRDIAPRPWLKPSLDAAKE